MTAPETTQTETITLTEPAAEAVRALLAERKLEGYALRVFISGSGCSGYQYGMALDNNVRTEDTIVEAHGVKVLVDEVSIQYLIGATIEYVTGPSGSGFKINNPNMAPSCGCGQSADDSGGCSSCG